MSNLSLMAIMRDDPDFGKRIQKKVAEIKEDKKNILIAADDYGNRYKQEILEGTELRAKMLTEGASKGLNEEQIMSSFGRFVPTVYTPILNMLYFLLRESEPIHSNRYRQRDAINEALIRARQLNHDDKERDLTPEELSDLLDDKLKEVERKTSTPSASQRKEINSQFEKESRNRPREEDVKLKDTPEMMEYLYGNITLDMFNKIKKLKALSKSSNEQEAFQAYRKAVDLCKQYNLDFDRIPCYVETREE